MIRELRFFVRLCQDRSIRKASQALFITPQGLSSAMKSLEAELGVQLFTRSSAGIDPTAAGKLVAKKAGVILDEFANMKTELRELGSETGGRMRVTVAGGVLHTLQPDFLYDYQVGYPEVELLVGEYPDLAGEQALLDGEAEVGLGIGPVDKRKFVSFKLRSGAISVILSRTHALALEKRLDFRDLLGEKWVVPNEKYKAYHAIVAKCSALGVKSRISMVAADIGALFKFCDRNTGVGFAAAEALAESGYDSLVAVPLSEESACPWDVHCITKRRTTLSPIARNFVEFVRSWFQNAR